MKTKKPTTFNYETYVVHVEITSKINFVEHQSAKSIEDVVLNAINLDSIDNTIVSSFVKSFLSSVDYGSIADYVNESFMDENK